MKSLFYPAFDILDIREIPDPRPLPDEVVLRVEACGLCGSELETFKNRSPRRMPPLVMGHEFCGTIASVGEGVEEIEAGARFVSNSVISCGDCARCRRGDTHLCGKREVFGMHRAGAFAEYVRVPVGSLIPWPDGLPAEAACLAEPLANGVHVANLTRHLSVSRALVIGAGPIGLMCQQALQSLRLAEVMVCDLSEGRLKVAARLGAAQTVCSKDINVAEAAKEWTEGEGVDLVVDAAGSAATKRLSLAALRFGGAAVWIGLHADAVDINSYEITLPEKQVMGTYAAKKEELVQALELMRNRQADVTSWVEAVPLDRSVAAFHRMANPSDSDLKAVFLP